MRWNWNQFLQVAVTLSLMTFTCIPTCGKKLRRQTGWNVYIVTIHKIIIIIARQLHSYVSLDTDMFSMKSNVIATHTVLCIQCLKYSQQSLHGNLFIGRNDWDRTFWMMKHIITNTAKYCTTQGAQTTCSHQNHVNIVFLRIFADCFAWFIAILWNCFVFDL